MPSPIRNLLLRRGLAAIDAARRVRERGLRRWIRRERVMGLRMVKTAVAAAVAWKLAGFLPGSDTVNLLAPMVAMATVQVTIYESLRLSVQQLVATAAGLGVALLLGHSFGVTAWSVGLVILIGLLLGSAVRLSELSSMVATSAFLIVLLGDSYGASRLLDTGLGAAVGIVINMAVVPPLYTRSAREAMGNVAEDLADLLRDIGGELPGLEQDTTVDWLDRARRMDRDVDAARTAIEKAERSLRFNPRLLQPGWRPAVGAEHLLVLENVVNEVRGIARGLSDLAYREEVEPEAGASPTPHELVGEVLRAAADATDAYARTIDGGGEEALVELRDRVEACRAIHQRVTRSLHQRLSEEPMAWPVYGSMLADVRKVMYEVSRNVDATGERRLA